MLVEVDPPRRLSPVQSSGNIGRDIRALRRSRNWTLNDLAEQLGRSVGWLSQVERDVTEPALEDIRKIAALFNLPVGFFFTTPANQNEQHHIVRAGSGRVMNDTSKGLREVLLSPDLDGQRFDLNPGDSFRFASETISWVNEGSVDAVVVWVIAPPVY